MIHVFAEIQLADGRRDEFLAAFQHLVPKVRAEEGCIEYGPAIDITTSIPGQPTVRENVVAVVEKWASIPALEAHLAASHMEEFRGQVKDLVRGLSIRVLQPV